jgi:hypothetical protein
MGRGTMLFSEMADWLPRYVGGRLVWSRARCLSAYEACLPKQRAPLVGLFRFPGGCIIRRLNNTIVSEYR